MKIIRGTQPSDSPTLSTQYIPQNTFVSHIHTGHAHSAMKPATILPVSTKPAAAPAKAPAKPAPRRRTDSLPLSRKLCYFWSFIALLVIFQGYQLFFSISVTISPAEPLDKTGILDKCSLLNTKPGPPPNFHARTQSDRFVAGTKSTLIKVTLYFYAHAV